MQFEGNRPYLTALCIIDRGALRVQPIRLSPCARKLLKGTFTCSVSDTATADRNVLIWCLDSVDKGPCKSRYSIASVEMTSAPFRYGSRLVTLLQACPCFTYPRTNEVPSRKAY